MKARVTVTLKNGVLDPQGKAIEGALGSLGFDGVGSVRQGKVFDVELTAGSEGEAQDKLKSMCEQLLANTVIEDYAITLVE
ncbi:phosphoribosylformylglycinamidine synthase subunit PurS [Cucumibacter marinus]|uniref:phosphoribosylformylglycinamidine synthase subunit PurS n=1 Tax=Cucumibacter marinus TaxID=1121252 RepID=UPI000426A947|nr:phosphoribosylformylglycinamidine synthase subunit PurS [Cucumibacter marinus]